MRDLTELDVWRVRDPRILGQDWAGDERCGMFRMTVGFALFSCIAASDMGWDHVSVSLHNRCPRWNEMEELKRRFFKPDEVVMQLHVAESQHISVHPYCLHLWRPHGIPIPLPPKEFV